jgi:dienelactone hydrolase
MKERCMGWIRFSHGLRLGPSAKGPPEALVVLLPDLGTATAMLMPVASRWATTVPTTAFVVLDSKEASVEPLLSEQLRNFQLDANRLVMVGFGYGGTLALHMLLRQGWNWAGVLAFSARLTRLPGRILRTDIKVRLVECVDDRHADHASLRDVVASLTARGIDVRGTSLPGSFLSAAAIRHGGAYLVELVATAQRGAGFRADQKSDDAE